MESTLGSAKDHLQTLATSGETARALNLCDKLLAAFPSDLELYFRFAEILVRAGHKQSAASLYKRLGELAVQTGHPTWAIVAADALIRIFPLEPECQQGRAALLTRVARTYANGAPRIDKHAAAPPAIDPDTPFALEQLDQDDSSIDALVERSWSRVAVLGRDEPETRPVRPLPFFSTLAEGPMRALLETARSRYAGPNEIIIRQGEPGQAFYLVAFGELSVAKQNVDCTVSEVASLRENALVGEMALLSDQPRAASVVARPGAVVIETPCHSVSQLATRHPALLSSLTRFTRERLIRNLLSTSPLFTPFSEQQKSDLLAHFEGLELPPGTVVIQEGEVGRGLYVILSGSVAVTVRDDTEAPPVARLGSGDVFGETSLLSEAPTNATVTTTEPSSLLFFQRAYFLRLVAAIPELRAYFETLSERRNAETRARKTPVPTTASGLSTTATNGTPLL